MTLKKLSSMPYAQATVITLDDGTKILRSYSTDVCKFTSDGDLFCYGLYSNTTRKHISAFMRELNILFPNGTRADYYTAKQCYEMRMGMNVFTGVLTEM